jgi:drug/metabolite transporter (DMT)-like permease
MTLLLSALTLIRKVTWLRWIGVAFVVFAALSLILFRTKLGAAFWKLFGRDQFGRKPEK